MSVPKNFVTMVVEIISERGEMMRIGILGAGSIGLLFASYLSKQFDVTLFPHRLEQSDLINEKGVTLQTLDSTITSKVKATLDKEEFNKQELIIVAVKQYQLANIRSDLNNIHKSIPLLFLQNGMLHLKLIDHLQHESIMVGSVEHGALKVNETTVAHNGIGLTKLAPYRGEITSISSLLNLHCEYFQFTTYSDYREILLKKLLVNAIINPLTAILKVKNGELIKNNFFMQIFHDLYSEIIPLFPELDSKNLLNEIIWICRNTENNESSMLKDIKFQRKTEIDAIVGYIVELAKDKNVRLPLTNMLYGMVKGMEKGGTE